MLNQLGLNAPRRRRRIDDNAAVVAAVEAELGSDWPKQVEPRFDANKAILFGRPLGLRPWDLARAFYNATTPCSTSSFKGLGKTIADEAAWFARQGQGSRQGRVRVRADSRRRPWNPWPMTPPRPALRATWPW